MTRSLLLGLLFIVSWNAGATDLRKITRAKTSLALEIGLAEDTELRIKRDRCKWELDGADLPRTCFEVSRLEARLGTISKADELRQWSWLEKLCVKRVRAAARVESLAETSNLPASCRVEAERRLDDLRYRMEEERPDQLFIRKPDAWTGS